MDNKELVIRAVEEKQDLIVDVSDKTFDFAETGFHEFKTAKLYEEVLKEEGFSVEMGLAGMPTAFKAVYGEGKPVIGYLAEYDALPELSQKGGLTKRVPTDDENPDGHGCGHNLLGAGTFAAALAMKAYLEKNPGKGTVVLFGCPSEEKGNGKTLMARDGIFDGVDVAFTWHPSDTNRVVTTSTLANVSVFFRFKGITSQPCSRCTASWPQCTGCRRADERRRQLPERAYHFRCKDSLCLPGRGRHRAECCPGT